MALGIKDIIVQYLIDNIAIIHEQQVQVFESFRNPKCFHFVFWFQVSQVTHIAQWSVAACFYFGVSFKCIENLDKLIRSQSCQNACLPVIPIPCKSPFR